MKGHTIYYNCLAAFFLSLVLHVQAQDSEQSEKLYGESTNYFTLGLTGSFPVGNYGDEDILNDEAVFARPGFGANFSFVEFVNESPVFLHVDVNIFLNKSTSFEKQSEFLNEINPGENNRVNKNPFFITAPVLVGLGLGADNGNVDFYSKVSVGYSLLKMTEV
jgi:hypothetical protein